MQLSSQRILATLTSHLTISSPLLTAVETSFFLRLTTERSQLIYRFLAPSFGMVEDAVKISHIRLSLSIKDLPVPTYNTPNWSTLKSPSAIQTKARLLLQSEIGGHLPSTLEQIRLQPQELLLVPEPTFSRSMKSPLNLPFQVQVSQPLSVSLAIQDRQIGILPESLFKVLSMQKKLGLRIWAELAT